MIASQKQTNQHSELDLFVLIVEIHHTVTQIDLIKTSFSEHEYN